MMINTALAQTLIQTQFPQWASLPISPVAHSGWDNRTFHLGDEMLIRLPSAEDYAPQVRKEQTWLPYLATSLPLPIPTPIAMGQPSSLFPYPWSIYRWLSGEIATRARIQNLNQFAVTLADFLVALHAIDAKEGPVAGPHNFYRGGSLAVYDAEVHDSITQLDGLIDTDKAKALWQTALASHWPSTPVWVHGDISAGNLLVENGQLKAVIRPMPGYVPRIAPLFQMRSQINFSVSFGV